MTEEKKMQDAAEKEVPAETEAPETAEMEVPETEAPETAEAAEEESGKKEKKSEIKKLKNEAEALRKQLEEEKAKADELNDKYLRIAAEYENFRKRTQNERNNIYKDAVADTLGGLLPILDNLQYAAKYSGGDAEKVAEGLTMILSKLPETLEKMNIRAFGEAGEEFDPNLHNAVLHVEDESLGENVIAEVLQCGYMYGDKVLRYAMVKTAN